MEIMKQMESETVNAKETLSRSYQIVHTISFDWPA